MKHALALTTFVSAAALSLAACDSEDVENTPIDDVDEIGFDSVHLFGPMHLEAIPHFLISGANLAVEVW